MRTRDQIARGIVVVGGAVALLVAIRGVWSALHPPHVEGTGGIGAVSSGLGVELVLLMPPIILLSIALRVVARRRAGIAARFRSLQLWAAIAWLGIEHLLRRVRETGNDRHARRSRPQQDGVRENLRTEL